MKESEAGEGLESGGGAGQAWRRAVGNEGMLVGCHPSKGLAYSQSSKEGSGRGREVRMGCMGKDIRTLGPDAVLCVPCSSDGKPLDDFKQRTHAVGFKGSPGT